MAFSAPVRVIADEDLVSLGAVDIGYQTATEPLLKNVNLNLRPGMRMLIRGPNGMGKSTLFSAIQGGLGDVRILGGLRTTSMNLSVNTFNQDCALLLDKSKSPIETVIEEVRSGEFGDISISNQRIQGVLGALGLNGEAQNKRVGELSGGQKARVALANFVIRPANLLLLDEPSNHLDIECLDALTAAISTYEREAKVKHAAICVISHDVNFCENLDITHVATIREGGNVCVEERALRDDEFSSNPIVEGKANGGGEHHSQKVLSADEDAKMRKAILNAPRRLAKLEKIIEQREKEVAKIEEMMTAAGSDFEALQQLQLKKEEAQGIVESSFTEYEELNILLNVNKC